MLVSFWQSSVFIMRSSLAPGLLLGAGMIFRLTVFGGSSFNNVMAQDCSIIDIGHWVGLDIRVILFAP